MVVVKQVYVGALWHQDCDPFCYVVAKDAATCERVLQECSKEEFQLMVDSADDEFPYEDDIMTGGVFFEGKYELDEEFQLEELNTTGYVVL